jgi:hypothetical protein
MDRLDLHEQIEVSRPTEPDVSPDVAPQDPKQADRMASVKAFDAVLGAAVRRVDVPAGLTTRILHASAVESAAMTGRRRRRAMIAGLTSALALSLVIGFSLLRWPEPTWNSDLVARAAATHYSGRHGIPAPEDSSPPLPQVGVRDGVAIGYHAVPFLKKPAAVYRLKTGNHEAVAILVDANWFPEGFAFGNTYVDSPNGLLEVRFRYVESTEQYCILIGPDLKPFEEKTIIL